ncbi:MAG: bacillithiol biosynthesis cysteine-adding enzyme BshC [Bacteroidia bacterium]|nr:bacillithiol biosynthesis cysteine-adding enzyme BshC [Bacteroidia bacterium]
MPNFEKTEVFLSDLKLFDKLILDYLTKSIKTPDLTSFAPDLDGLIQNLASGKKAGIDRHLLVTVLKEQYSYIESSTEKDEVFEQIDLLEKEDTFTVCTGHQLNLFSGPLYTILKIITTINSAKELSRKSGKKVIPIYWLASEDHDIEEINHVFVHNQKYVWSTTWHGPSGRVSCEGIQEVISVLRTKYGNAEFGNEVFDLLETSYQSNFTLAQATRRLLHKLFGHHGLIILDADDVRLKKTFIPHMLNDALHNIAEKKVTETTDKLSAHYKIQVHPRKVNLFYLYGDKRERIEVVGDGLTAVGTEITWTKKSFEEEVTLHPDRFSPNVVLRPLYQETILPNIAMIGGPAEIAYWLELRAFFQISKVAFPVLLLRNSAMFLDEPSLIRMKKLKIGIEKLFLSVDVWIRDYISASPDSTFSIEEKLQNIDQIFQSLGNDADKIDHTLKSTIEAEQHRIRKSMKGIEEKLLRSLKRKNETEINQIYKLHEKLFPFEKLQERTENILPFLLKYGFNFIDELIKELEPFKNSIVIFEEHVKAEAGKLKSINGLP